jgi:hypothetical protein
MSWETIYSGYLIETKPGMFKPTEIQEYVKKEQPFIYMSKCISCGMLTVWLGDKLLHPMTFETEPAEDMPANVRESFVEACSIARLSPRAACAMFRVTLERLVNYVATARAIPLKETDRLFDKIKKLNLPEDTMRLFSTARLVGNSGAHSSLKTNEIDFSGEDTFEVTVNMAELINGLVRILVSPYVAEQRLREKLSKQNHDAS